MHRINAELERTRNKPNRFKQLNFNAMAAHEQTLFVLPVKKKTRVNSDTGKASQRVDASIRHMHREHSAYSNRTCALRAPFASHTFHSCFYLCRAREENTRPPNEHSVDNPNVLTKQPTRTQCVSVK